MSKFSEKKAEKKPNIRWEQNSAAVAVREREAVAAAEKKPEELEIPADFAPALLKWYRENARVLPWRDDPQPYKVWVSEIMLQQTRVEAVKPYFQRFMETLPDLKSLAEAEEQVLLKLWEGLGYYNRVRNLQKAARQALEEYGDLPADEKELIRLPGIGPYTAGAVASIAFGRSVPAVDGNVLRVVTRLMAYEADITKESVKKEVARALQPSVSEEPAAFNQAVMELGATVCLPNGAPKCEECPAAYLCQAHREGKELGFPVKKAKKARKIEQKTIFLLEFRGKTALCRRPDSGLLAGLWGFPECDDYLEEEEVASYLENLGLQAESIQPLGKAKHIFSHIEWHMVGYRVILEEFTNDGETDRQIAEVGLPALSLLKDAVFLTKETIEGEYALPSAYRAYIKQL